MVVTYRKSYPGAVWSSKVASGAQGDRHWRSEPAYRKTDLVKIGSEHQMGAFKADKCVIKSQRNALLYHAQAIICWHRCEGFGYL